MPSIGAPDDRLMPTFLRLSLLIVIVAGLAAGCRAPAVESPRPSLGELISPLAPPAPLDPYYEDEPGQVWVHGRWARIDGQWHWQPGYHVPARPGEVFVNGYWDKRGGQFEWVPEAWRPERPGFVYVPGRWDHRGSAFVWIRDQWLPAQEDKVWVQGRWSVEGDQRVWVDGRWADPDEAVAAR